MDSWIPVLFNGLKSITVITYLFDAQIAPDLASRSSFRLAPVLLTCPQQAEHFLTFWHEILQAHLAFLLVFRVWEEPEFIILRRHFTNFVTLTPCPEKPPMQELRDWNL